MKKLLAISVFAFILGCGGGGEVGSGTDWGYVVSFDSQGGSSVQAQNVPPGGYPPRPADPVRVGYSFGGWLLNGMIYNFNTPVYHNFTLVASWLNSAQSQYTNSTGMAFKYIPAGTFMMGSTDSEAVFNDETPRHRVTLTKAFYIGVYEVTQGQWKAVMGMNPAYHNEMRLGVDNSSNYPVESVTWEEIQIFINILNTKEAGITYRLPTEAEWEYAARAGTTTPYPGGNDEMSIGYYAWFIDNANTTHPIGQKMPNAWGLYDVFGNVYELVQDWWYRIYSTSPVVDPVGPPSGEFHMARGCGWNSIPMYCRAAYRDAMPTCNDIKVGLRLVMEKNH